MVVKNTLWPDYSRSMQVYVRFYLFKVMFKSGHLTLPVVMGEVKMLSLLIA